ncbi:MAG: DUF1016 N-terminal domain-containing protein, partial [Endomicrobiia bacterium]|nr:DUF1016 N-terminal domain-containing protein [Endomicrobiia bacterium]
MPNITTNDYKKFLGNLKTEILSARRNAYRSVNKQLVELYLRIGRGIYEKTEISEWGQGVVEKLSADLRKEFPDMKGFSVQNLWRMKQFYETYRQHEKLSPLVRELTWSHNLVILHATDSVEEKEF